MIKRFILVLLLLGTTTAIGQQSDGTDPNFWCNVSRSQVSAERDAGLASRRRVETEGRSTSPCAPASLIAASAWGQPPDATWSFLPALFGPSCSNCDRAQDAERNRGRARYE